MIDTLGDMKKLNLCLHKMREILEEHFSDLISQKEITKPHGIVSYNVINFQKVITKLFPDFNLTISIENFDIRKKLINKYKNDKDCFKEYGTSKEYSVTSLLYYQTDTGIEGPKYHDINDPVSIVKYGELLILWEGYHRVLRKIVTGHLRVSGYELELYP
jgi:hypothetical protein